MQPQFLFLTGKLAQPSLTKVVTQLGESVGFEPQVVEVGVSVAALMHADLVARRLASSETNGVEKVFVPGWCQGDLSSLTEKFGVPFERGPKDLFDLPEYFGKGSRPPVVLDEYDIEILAEINHAPRMSDREILTMASHFRDSGANLIDLGCVPGECWGRSAEVTRLLKQDGFRVSIDSFDRAEVEAAVAAGAELVLSCNRSNVEWAAQLDVEFVAIPDAPFGLESLAETVDVLKSAGRRFRIDPIVEPIGFGFAASLARYFEARRRWPDLEIMMGIGNLTELTEVDSVGVNFLLAAICQELGVRSVLTTEVINWARSAVKEFDLARRHVFHSIKHRALPKHVDASLLLLRDPKLREMGADALQQLAAQIRDPNYRIFVEQQEIHVMNRDGYWHGRDPFVLFDQFSAAASEPLAASHAFYLGHELSKAATALLLGKQFTQDETLRWGFLTTDEASAIERRRHVH